MNLKTTYTKALQDALALMDAGVEPRSALKQAGADNGIAYGITMQTFVTWAEKQLYPKQPTAP